MKNIFLALALLVISSAGLTADGEYDTTFDGDGFATYAIDLVTGGFDVADAIVTGPGGASFLIGTANDTGSPDLVVVKLTASGARDLSFGSANGEAQLDYPLDTAYVHGVDGALQEDGKLVLAFTTERTVMPFDDNIAVVRLNANGTMDGSFGAGGLAVFDIAGAQRDDSAHAVGIDSNGRIVVAGSHVDASGQNLMMAMRLNNNGSLNTTFAGGIRTAEANTNQHAWGVQLAIDSDDSVYIIGGTQTSLGDEDFAIWKLTDIGQNDNSFAGDGIRTLAVDINGFDNDRPYDVAVRPEGGIIIVGGADSGSMDFQIVAAVINHDGDFVTDFGNQTPRNGFFLLEASTIDTNGGDYATSVGIQPDGKFVLSAVVETSDGFDVGSLRLNPDGSNDIGYGFLGLRIYDLDFGGDDEFAAKLALDHLNRILIAGSASFAGASDHDYLAIRLENSDDTIFRSAFGGDLH